VLAHHLKELLQQQQSNSRELEGLIEAVDSSLERVGEWGRAASGGRRDAMADGRKSAARPAKRREMR
jgi:hypothetical protein